MLILIACEYSGIVRDAFSKEGHEAVSADYLPTERPGPHYQGNVLDILNSNWDLVIAHPPCTYLSLSGVGRLKTDPSRWYKLDEAAKFFKAFLDCDADRVCIENPRMHHYAIDRIGIKETQTIQPYHFGHLERKTTCLWLRNLPKLQPTWDREKEMPYVPDEDATYLNNLPPSKDRGKIRSKTFTGIAKAFAQQWGNL